MGIVKSVLILLVGAALATFLWSNYDQRVIIYFTQRFRTYELALSTALVLALVVGFLLAVTLSLPNQFRLRRRLRELRKQMERREAEIAELRKLPLTEGLSAGGAGSVSSRSGPSLERGEAQRATGTGTSTSTSRNAEPGAGPGTT